MNLSLVRGTAAMRRWWLLPCLLYQLIFILIHSEPTLQPTVHRNQMKCQITANGLTVILFNCIIRESIDFPKKGLTKQTRLMPIKQKEMTWGMIIICIHRS